VRVGSCRRQRRSGLFIDGDARWRGQKARAPRCVGCLPRTASASLSIAGCKLCARSDGKHHRAFSRRCACEAAFLLELQMSVAARVVRSSFVLRDGICRIRSDGICGGSVAAAEEAAYAEPDAEQRGGEPTCDAQFLPGLLAHIFRAGLRSGYFTTSRSRSASISAIFSRSHFFIVSAQNGRGSNGKSRAAKDASAWAYFSTPAPSAFIHLTRTLVLMKPIRCRRVAFIEIRLDRGSTTVLLTVTKTED
jgi:hypothetical protein